MRAAAALWLLSGLVGRQAAASPDVDHDHPVYDELSRLSALGIVDAPDGFRPLSVARVQSLLAGAHETVPFALPFTAEHWWVSPVSQLRLDLAFVRDHPRPYSTGVHPRNVAGEVSIACEHRTGSPCGNGEGLAATITTEAGYGTWLSSSLRLRALAGHDRYDPDVQLDRAYVTAEYGAAELTIGRDAVVIGPSSRTQLAWGDQAPPLDQVQVRTSAPVRLLDALRFEGLYLVGRLRAPQTYPGALATVARAQLDIARSTQVGTFQLLELGGDGAPSLSAVDFVLEHVRRKDASAGATDSSNRRFGFDISSRILELSGMRLYYAIVFEDIRRARLVDAVRYDADHLFGIELAAIGPGRRHGLTLEWHQTGIRSQEHTPRTTGFTNAGFVVGAPLGPDARSLYAGGRIALSGVTMYPWLELARLSSDTYEIVPYGPINRTSVGEDESRYRIGARARVPLRTSIWLEGEAMFEHVEDVGFESGVTRNNGGLTASIIWYPDAPLGRLKLN